MFEFYQQVAFRFAKHNETNYVQDNEMVREIRWEDATRISMIGDSCLPSLPDEPNSKRILTLLLQEVSCLVKFPGSFFVHMSALQLLDLYKTKIETLPSSISSLKNLKAMFLKNCDQLTELRTEVGDLHSLEILDICHTGIYHLPPVIGNLTALKCLRVSFKKIIWNQNHVNGGLSDMISSNVIASLHSLEELGIVVDPTDGRWCQNVGNIVAEIAVLKELTTLCFYFPTMKCFETFISTSILWNGNNPWKGDRLRSVNIIVGHQQGNSFTKFDVSEWSAEKWLTFSAGETFPDAILKILKQACSFELIGHKAANLSEFSADYLQGLEVCMIEDCPEMTSIIDGRCTTGAAFQHLNKLHIDSLPKLEQIWKGSIVSESLVMLTHLTLKGCHNLKVVFSKEMVKLLNRLQFIQIEDCHVMKEIIKDGSTVEPCSFPKLKSLELINLPLLSKICNDATLTWNSLEVLKIESCALIEEITKDEGTVDSGAFPKLKNFELVNLPKLSRICKNVSLKWDSLETLRIDSCMALKTFPATFQRAEKLIAIYCSQNLWNQVDWLDVTDVTKMQFQKLYKHI
ncbi:probable disease resistance protein At4g27220 isoform X1 [Mangifera indica]|uniref:probable disease resistance protein At4g27220 isoform X1 n=1 Tax=Mangifera indica TaxID=29780 RepID=UPI001CFAAA90|nr:probable disease resistance protein At4g27220 isoform X1 [Mangifera indica]